MAKPLSRKKVVPVVDKASPLLEKSPSLVEGTVQKKKTALDANKDSSSAIPTPAPSLLERTFGKKKRGLGSNKISPPPAPPSSPSLATSPDQKKKNAPLVDKNLPLSATSTQAPPSKDAASHKEKGAAKKKNKKSRLPAKKATALGNPVTTRKNEVTRKMRSLKKTETPVALTSLPEPELATFIDTIDLQSSNTTPPPEHEDNSPLRVLFVTAECTPLAQTGGLGDAVAGLCKALHYRGHDVRIVMPLYRRIDRKRFNLTFSHACCVHFGKGEEIWVGVHAGKLDGVVPLWLIDYERYFGRTGLYDEPTDPDNAYRFGLLSKAALQICKDLNFTPQIAHVHDWMSSPVSVFLKTWDRVLSPLSETASVLTIHNLGYQGKAPASVMSFFGLGDEHLHSQAFEDFGGVNLLKAGIQYSDAITTVSPTYADEILTSEGGQGLAPYLNNRRSDLFGILNGVDSTIWNPATDPLIPAHYHQDDLAGKAVCKRVLQEKFGLEVNPRIPLFGIVSRFASQKGFDLIRGALPQALRDMVIQVVALGSGDPLTENFFRWLSGAFPGRANAHIGFASDLAHLIEAGSDFFIMPSIYEPCGLNQMYSSLYGTLPIVRATGGLEDTVENYDERLGQGTGFKFWEISDRALFYTLGWANSTWWDRPEHIRRMQQNGMARDFSWNSSAVRYEQVYHHALLQRKALV